MREKIQSTCVAAAVRPGIHSHSFSAASSDISASSSYLSNRCFSTMRIRQTKHSSTRVKTTLLYKTHLKNINALCSRTLRSIGKRPTPVVPSQRACVSRSLKTNMVGRMGVGCVGFGSVQAGWRRGGDSKTPLFTYAEPEISQQASLPPRMPSGPNHRLRLPAGSEAQMSGLLISLCVADGCVCVHEAGDKSSSPLRRL